MGVERAFKLRRDKSSDVAGEQRKYGGIAAATGKNMQQEAEFIKQRSTDPFGFKRKTEKPLDATQVQDPTSTSSLSEPVQARQYANIAIKQETGKKRFLKGL